MASAGGGQHRGGSRRVSFLFRRSQGAGHCAGVNALALSPDEQQLWTASRDSIICCWDATQQPQSALLHEHVGHVDWVNDLALAGNVLVSCSSDRTLRLWQPDSPGEALGCLRGHSDYATCLAASADGTMLASGGLRGEVLLWDLAALRAVMAGSAQDQRYGATAAELPRDSVYALAMSGGGTLVAAGSTQGAVSVVDGRSGHTVMTLKGHTDNVRALQLDPEGRLLLSGGADHSMRLWDLSTQRCLHTLTPHTDSVWALAAAPGFGVVYSGGRDGCIYRTRLATRVSELLAREQRPVVRLAVGQEERHLWAATTGPSVHNWELQAPNVAAAAIGGGGSAAAGTAAAAVAAVLPATPRSPLGAGGGGIAPQPLGAGAAASCFVASPSAAARARLSFEGHGPHPPPQQQQPVAATPGVPPIQRATVLTDRRHVLTQDAEGCVLCWDLTTGQVVRDYGRHELKEVEATLFQPCHSVSAWCAPEVRLGSLGGVLEPPQCFGAEVYAQDLGDDEAPPDLKVNFGEQMLLALFAGWVQQRRAILAQRQREQRRGSGGQQPEARQQQQRQGQWQGQQTNGSASCDGGQAPPAAGVVEGQQDEEQDGAMPDANADAVDDNGEGQGEGGAGASAPASRFVFQGPLAPVVMVSGGRGDSNDGSSGGSGGAVPWRCAIDAFTGEEDVPQWVSDCVLYGRYPVSRELKMAFQLMPLPGCGLPSLLQSKLNAPRVLRLNKVADYVRRKMEEHGIFLAEEPLFWDAAKAERWHTEQGEGGGSAPAAAVRQLQPLPPPGGGGGAVAGGAVLLTCGGSAVPWDFSLSAVRQWIWRRSDDLVLHYSVRDHSTPLKLPAIRPPT